MYKCGSVVEVAVSERIAQNCQILSNMAYMSGQEYESAAEKIVENYMGEYMDQYMQVPGSREVQSTEEYLELACRSGTSSTARRRGSSVTRSG